MAEELNTYEPATDYTDADWEIFGKWIKGVLITSTPTIIFTKKDGTERAMKCTLRTDALPVQEIKEDKAPRKQSTTSIAVYDIEANGWRSFTINTVKRVEFALSDD